MKSASLLGFCRLKSIHLIIGEDHSDNESILVDKGYFLCIFKSDHDGIMLGDRCSTSDKDLLHVESRPDSTNQDLAIRPVLHR
ncbi:unnamed protein product [Dovyalis caffra]|uniref:Uncharacterized protein n=1 Tax=Dovyalis caffra TaxID=77055 RepID=A0AAV1RWZ0_9ROSI|nr:unnamed protein product [Dovyalis caffra]